MLTGRRLYLQVLSAGGRGRRGVWWLRTSLAAVGVAVQFVGLGRGPVPAWAQLLHAMGLTLLPVASSLPLWRRASRGRGEILSGRAQLRPLVRRVGAGFLVLASLGLVAHRALALGGLSGASRASAVLGFTCLGLVPVALAAGAVGELVLGGQAQRSLELVRLLAGRRVSRRQCAAGVGLAFDPNVGAAGRTEPFYEFLGGEPRRNC